MKLSDYQDRFPGVKFSRQDGILQVTIHFNDGPAAWGPSDGGLHTQLGEAFHCIAHDEENRIVILSGTGDTFLTEWEPGEGPSNGGTTSFWHRIYREGKDLLQNLLSIEVPMIAAVNGPVHIHAEIPTLCDLVVASEMATFADKPHFVSGQVPGDGAHVWWPMLLGPNRGRSFLLTGEEIGAAEGKVLGFVAEVVPKDQVLSRAWEVARNMLKLPDKTLKYTRIALTLHIKRRLLDDLGYGLQLEGLSMISQFEQLRSQGKM
ncbi:enoyl-CoA hydratase [Cladophialophora psammophila CBS 110553]|uniref:Enoyl-CoA hydratase n=1 Tax=Cladophialophora psammophila CBS 110553 TaxID=1182543 RepID=W9WHN0_9EURO|nr:enoyl-CoA hydratase [Cladophialophora psammophila CBS 110553]EXJ67398.1 enoyl-CoA hydratase [Cladophialophora psammophila CBS 110553]